MKEYSIYPYRTDLILKEEDVKNNEDINVIKHLEDKYMYKTIIFNKITDNLKNILVKELFSFITIPIKHILIIGIGNDNYTSDSIGPKTLKHIRVNYNIFNIEIKSKIKVSALEPGAFGETGILTEKIISSITKEIKPDIIVLIDSFITDNINYLNRTIEINNKGLYPGCGISSINSIIDHQNIGIPTLVIGVPTAIEVKFSNTNRNFKPYLLSTKDVDKYINIISQLLGESINQLINCLLQCQDNND